MPVSTAFSFPKTLARRACTFLSSGVLLLSAATAGAADALVGHPSPYLTLHSIDAVDWQVWSSPAIERAKKEDKLIFVASGYFSCHWCHVMQEENFLSEDVAKVMNDNFVNIVIDRELRPALDAYLVEFVHATNGRAGWPLHVFLTPDGHPLVGMTYMPRERFTEVLAQVTERWENDRDNLKAVAAQAADIIHKTHAEQEHQNVAPSEVAGFVQKFATHALGLGDDLNGGFGESSKFPSVPQLTLMLRAQAASPNKELGEFLTLTLERMASQGLRDHLGGGFFRYVTDPNWQVPHFEKMLYDNSLLTGLYLDAAKVLDAKAFADVAVGTVDFMLAELWREPGAFISSLSAVDSNDVEGGYYLWDADALNSVLDADEFAVVSAAWRLGDGPNLPLGYLPLQHETTANVAAELNITREEAAVRLERARTKLLSKRRAEREVPADDKLLAAWNGLALTALVRVYTHTNDEKYKEAASALKRYFAESLWDGKQLARAVSDKGALGDASLQDYAFAARGLLDFAEMNKAPEDLELVRAIVATAWTRFHGDKGWRLTDEMLIPYDIAEPAIADGALPSPSAALMDVTMRLAKQDSDDELQARGLEALQRGTRAMFESPFFHASRIAVLNEHMGAN